MNQLLLKRQLLSSQEIKCIDKFLDISNSNNYWQNGLLSLYGNNLDELNVKKNLELSNGDILKEIHNIIVNKLDQEKDFFNFVFPKQTSGILISKTEKGGYYNPHFDSYLNGHFSTTVFLNDPDEYEGGELCLFINGKEKKFKLKAGHAITYSTGIMHRVNMVKSGVRYASVFWTHSWLPDASMRNICYELENIKSSILNKKKNPSKKEVITCEEASENSVFLVDNLIESILRLHSK